MIGHWTEESLLYRVTGRNERAISQVTGVMTQSSSNVSMPAKGKWLY